MGDWQPKRDDDLGTGRGNSQTKWNKYLADRKGKNRFDFLLTVGVYNPDFSDVGPARNFSNLWLWSFGVCKGRELENWDGWIKGSVETMVSLIQREKPPREVTMVWEDDGRNLFNSFRGKKLDYDLLISVSTPGTVNVSKFKITLKNCHITSIYHEFHTIDNKKTKFVRIDSTCSGDVELKAMP